MATPINAPLTSEIWHLSIEDLLAPICEAPRLGGPGPFVINLSASSAPLSRPDKTFVVPGDAYVYQIQRMEDRRPRFRLRLGPFATEDAADAMLGIVRDVYPSALTATADSDDLKAIAALQPKPQIVAAPAAPPAAGAIPPVTAAPQIKSQPAQQAGARLQVPPAAVSIPVLSDCVEPTRRMPVPAAVPTSAMRAPTALPAAKRVTVEPAAPQASEQRPAATRAPPVAARAPVAPAVKQTPAAPPAVSQLPVAPTPPVAPTSPVAPTPRVSVPPRVAAPPAVAPPPRVAAPPPPDARPPSLESTQTLRPLTTSELEDSVARWYVIQLSISSESFDPESLPNLDIFNEYRLYCVAGLDEGRTVHALRLGFFADEVAAGAVASYLGTFYEKPTVKRISFAERERFRDQRVEARKDIGATGKHAVIEITGERHIREKRPRIAAVTALAPAASSSQSTTTPARKAR